MLLFIGISSFLGKNFQTIYSEPFVGTFYSSADFFNNKSDNLKLEELNIVERSEVECLFRKYSVNTVVLAAAEIHSKNKNDFDKINVLGVKNIIEAMKKNGIKKIVYISTAILAAPEYIWGDYGRTKKIAEDLIKNSGLEYVILRPTEIYGKYEKEGIVKLAKLIYKYPILPLFEKGKNMLSPIKAEDVCHIIVKCLKDGKYNNKTYLLCGGEKISFRDLALKIATRFNKKIYFIPVPKFIAQLSSFCLNKGQVARVLNSRAYDCALSEAEFDYKFKKVNFDYL